MGELSRTELELNDHGREDDGRDSRQLRRWLTQSSSPNMTDRGSRAVSRLSRLLHCRCTPSCTLGQRLTTR